MNQPDMKSQAQQIWSMLDEMAGSNPQAYRAFIDKNLKEGKESMKPPSPHMCVCTNLLNSGKGAPEKLFINMMEWQTVKAPESDEAPIPVLGGHLYHTKDENGSHKTLAVAFHPLVLKEFGIASPHIAERQMLVNLALDYICDQYNLNVSRNYIVLPEDTPCKGQSKKAQESITHKFYKQGGQLEEDLGDLEEALGPFAAGCKDSLLREMANITMDSCGQDAASVPTSVLPNTGAISELKLLPDSNQSTKKGLIQEVSVPDEDSTLTRTPSYTVNLKESDEGKTQKMVVKIQLPDVHSVAECELTITMNDVDLVVPGMYSLKLPLERKIDDSLARAKFSKRSSSLTLTLPLS